MRYAFLFFFLLPFTQTSQAASLDEPRRIIHTLNRLSFGLVPEQYTQIKTQGLERYIEEQLHPEQISENPEVTQRLGALETLRLAPQTLYERYLFNKEPDTGANAILAEAQEARIIRAVLSRKQLQEVMVDFWFNHFNVFANKGGRVKLAVGDFEERAIRPLVIGRFEDLLKATARHPAMLVYLDNWLNTAPRTGKVKGRYRGLNENYARELLELHTLGVDGGYTQTDVIELARILTGWGLCDGPLRKEAPASGFCFDAQRHDRGDKTLLGRTFHGGGADEVDAALSFLARHPATAHHIAFQLAQAFVADQPPEHLVKQLSQTFLDTGGDIRAVLKTLFASEAFRDESAYLAKFKSPYRYVISVARITGGTVQSPRPLLNTLRQMNMPLFQCLTPDGYKNTQTAWLAPDSVLQRINFATRISRNAVPGVETSLGGLLTAQTRTEIASLEPALKTAALLASPEFLHY